MFPRPRKKEQSTSSASPKKSSWIRRLFARKSTPSTPPVQRPVSYVPVVAKPKRQPPKVIQRGAGVYTDVLRVLDPLAGATNAFIALVFIGWFVYSKPVFSAKGFVVGVGVVLLELALFGMLDKLHYAANAKATARRLDLFLMSIVGLAMLGSVSYVVLVWTTLVPSILVVVALAMSFPGVLVSMYDSLIKAEIELEAEAKAFAAVAAERAGLEEKETSVDKLLQELHQANAELKTVQDDFGDNANKVVTAASLAERASANLKAYITREGEIELEAKIQRVEEKDAAHRSQLEAKFTREVVRVSGEQIAMRDQRISELEGMIEELRSGASSQAARSFMDEDDFRDSDASHMTVRGDEDDD